MPVTNAARQQYSNTSLSTWAMTASTPGTLDQIQVDFDQRGRQHFNRLRGLSNFASCTCSIWRTVQIGICPIQVETSVDDVLEEVGQISRQSYVGLPQRTKNKVVWRYLRWHLIHDENTGQNYKIKDWPKRRTASTQSGEPDVSQAAFPPVSKKTAL
jgi:hypothetical protein